MCSVFTMSVPLTVTVEWLDGAVLILKLCSNHRCIWNTFTQLSVYEKRDETQVTGIMSLTLPLFTNCYGLFNRKYAAILKTTIYNVVLPAPVLFHVCYSTDLFLLCLLVRHLCKFTCLTSCYLQRCWGPLCLQAVNALTWRNNTATVSLTSSLTLQDFLIGWLI